MTFTRDSVLWLVLFVGGLATFLSGHFDLLTKAFALGPTWQARVELVGAIAGFVGAYLRMSPAPLSRDHELATGDAGQALTVLGQVPKL